jgi:hypothetical protein
VPILFPFCDVHRQALRAHKAALFAQRSFWKQLLHNSVTFRSLVKSFGHIESCRQRADHTYKVRRVAHDGAQLVRPRGLRRGWGTQKPERFVLADQVAAAGVLLLTLCWCCC